MLIDGIVNEEKGISRSPWTPNISILIKKTLSERSGKAIVSDSEKARIDSNPIGTIKNSTNGTKIRFAGIEINERTPKEFIMKGRVAKEAAKVILTDEMIFSLNVLNLKG